jgi:hypothetical protein
MIGTRSVVSVPNSYFHRLSPLAATPADAPTATATFAADPATGGPWVADLQHGGPPNALLVSECERLAAAHTGRADLVALRLAAEFVGPVPVADVTVQTRIVRAARTAVLVAGELSAAGRTCLQGRVWLVRTADTTGLAPDSAPDVPLAPAPPAELPPLGGGFPYADSLDWRVERGGMRVPGAGAAWVRARMPVIPDAPLTGLQLAALIGDSASGLSSELDWSQWSFLNIDLDIHLARPVRGDWLRMDAITQLGPTGTALAQSALSDLAGRVGTTTQTLILERLGR